MKLNWGKKLVIVYVAFVALMGYLVYRSVTTHFDLVTPEYYKDELAYQNVIDGSNRANQLTGKVSVQQNGQYIVIRLPEEMKFTTVSGNAWFYCAQDARKDHKIDLQTDRDARQVISSKTFIPGHYTVKISWDSNGKNYYAEQPIIIQ